MNSEDLIDRLSRENPVPGDLPMLPIESILRQLGAEPPTSRVPWGRRARRGVPIVLSVIVSLAVAAALITAGARRPTPTPSRTAPRQQTIAELAASQFAVFGRAQTARDRSLPMILQRAATRGGLGAGFRSILHGAIPSLTRYTQTLPDGREVFLAVYRPGSLLPPRTARAARALARSRDRSILLRIIIVQPTGAWTDGQPVMDPGGGETAGDAYLEARSERQGCVETTYWNILPNQVATIRWQFPRQDAYGYVYRSPLTVTLPVRGNIAAATIPSRAPCDRPSVVTLYGHHGQVLSRTGSTAQLNQVSRPVRHGNPLAGLEQIERRARPRSAR